MSAFTSTRLFVVAWVIIALVIEAEGFRLPPARSIPVVSAVAGFAAALTIAGLWRATREGLG